MSAGLAQRDAETVRQVLLEAIEPTVETLLTAQRTDLTVEEAERLLDELIADIRAQLPADWQGLSDYAVSREGIYEDHP